MLAGEWVGRMAMPALAALLILTAWNMSEPHKWPDYMKLPASDRILLILTCVLTVLVDLTVAIGIGVSLGLAFCLKNRTVTPESWSEHER
jgi:SulP family sulfate permease